MRNVDGHSSITSIDVQLVASSSPTTTPTPTCDDSNKEIYFISMIVLASVLGVLLSLLLVFVCIKCCRNCSNFSISKPSKRAPVSSIYAGGVGASYKSFSEMNYVTLQSPPSNKSSPDLGVRVNNAPSGRVRSRPKTSRKNLPTSEDHDKDRPRWNNTEA